MSKPTPAPEPTEAKNNVVPMTTGQVDVGQLIASCQQLRAQNAVMGRTIQSVTQSWLDSKARIAELELILEQKHGVKKPEPVSEPVQ